jgi:hypothetical protein
MLAAASLGLLLAAGESVRWNASLETQARGRDQPSLQETGRTGVGELDLHALLGVSMQDADGAAALTYLPSILVSQVAFGAAGQAGNATRHAGRLELRTMLTPTTRLATRSTLDWGLTDFSPLSGQLMSSGQVTPAGQVAPSIVARLPPQRFVRTLGVEVMVDLAHAFSRRLQLSATAGWQRSGGVGHAAVEVLPLQVGPTATAALSWAADRANTLRLLASASESRFSLGRSSVLSDLGTDWTLHAFSHTMLDAAAGVTFLHTSGLGSSSSATYPSGTLGVAWDLPRSPQSSLRASLRVGLAPGVDRLTALAIQTVRAEGRGELTEGPLHVAVSGSQGHAISGVGAGADDLRFETHASWIVAHGWSVESGLGAARTNQLFFTGWQVQALVGVRWNDHGSF